MNIKKFLIFALFMAVVGAGHADNTTDQATATTKKYVTDELSELQTAILAQSGAKAVTYTTTPGTIAPREVKTNLGTSTSDNAIPTVGAVNTGLATKQKEIPAVDTNTVVTYTDTAGTVGEKGIYQDTRTYAEQQNNFIDAGTFNAALQNALNMEFVCAGYVDDDPTKPCWLWQIHNTTENHTINLFDISKITVDPRFYPDEVNIVHNADGSISVTSPSTSNGVLVKERLSEVAPGLEVGKTYVLSFANDYSGKGAIYLVAEQKVWYHGQTRTITQEILNSQFYVYAADRGTTSTIYNIQIEEGTTPTPFQPYNLYIPQNQ